MQTNTILENHLGEGAKIGIVMIATNSYLQRWFDAATGIDEFAFQKNNVNIHLFTDQAESAKQWASSNLSRVKLITHEIPNYGWPEATLFRYKLIVENSNSFDEELLMYLDSDMVILNSFDEILEPNDWKNGLGFVQHPGFFRPRGIQGFLCRVSNPNLILKDIRQLLTTGNISPGSWESRKRSTAFVSREKRTTYVHGAVWFGLRYSFLEMSRALAENISQDLSNGITAVWHDESHLNWYYAEVGGSILDSRLSYVPKYGWNKFSDPRIMNVEKRVGEGRIPTSSFEQNR